MVLKINYSFNKGQNPTFIEQGKGPWATWFSFLLVHPTPLGVLRMVSHWISFSFQQRTNRPSPLQITKECKPQCGHISYLHVRVNKDSVCALEETQRHVKWSVSVSRPDIEFSQRTSWELTKRMMQRRPCSYPPDIPSKKPRYLILPIQPISPLLNTQSPHGFAWTVKYKNPDLSII